MNLPSSFTKISDPRHINFFHKKAETPKCPPVPTHDDVQIDDLRRSNTDKDNTSNHDPTHHHRRRSRTRLQRWSGKTAVVLKRHCAFIGPGIVASVGYTDPGNWVTDLAAGSQFGYALLFTVLLSGLFGIFLQILAVRMGVVTGNDLACNTRLLCLPEGPDGEIKEGIRWRKTRTGLLWFSYLIAEGALIATELAELIGSAIALNLLFPSLPVWGGVLVTSADVLIILFIYKPNGNFRILEWFIGGLVFAVIACYIALLVKVKPDWGNVFHGYIPSSTLIGPEALYASIGILGAVIMPHSLFLGSHFATIHRIPEIKSSSSSTLNEDDRTLQGNQDPGKHTLLSRVKKIIAMVDSDLVEDPDAPKKTFLPKRLGISQMKIQIPHASWDIALSLVIFAITVNSAILIVAAAAFYYGTGSTSLSDLYDAFNLLNMTLGKVYAILFAIALLAAGQSASITVTLAGQLVSEGFIKWKTNAFVRRLLTRLITIAPSIAIAVGVGRNGLDETLIASQVALSFALPVVLVPLILITSLKSWMEVTDTVDTEAAIDNAPEEATTTPSTDMMLRSLSSSKISAIKTTVETPSVEQVPEQSFLPNAQFISHNFTSPRYIIALAVVVYITILLADAYSLVTTIMA
ncbi:hypothetical protein CBS101457_003466 [Exobasidium rhododendri]|nr:hypothetical protein CBS101457_003466 [Exobasidium rhododendri]